MQDYFYVSSKRLHNLARQIDADIIIERTISDSQTDEKAEELGAKAKASLLKLIELQAKASTSNIKGHEYRSENTYKKSDTAWIEKVLAHLNDKNKYTSINKDTSPEVLCSIMPGRLLKFVGSFQPIIDGNSFRERCSNFKKGSALVWRGICGNIFVEMVANQESLQSATPVYQILRNPELHYSITGFGTNIGYSQNSKTLSILPLIFGTIL